jgi:hypothetical protein
MWQKQTRQLQKSHTQAGGHQGAWQVEKQPEIKGSAKGGENPTFAPSLKIIRKMTLGMCHPR